MEKTKSQRLAEIERKIISGVKLAFLRMLEEAKEKDEELVIAVNGVPKRIRAKDIK